MPQARIAHSTGWKHGWGRTEAWCSEAPTNPPGAFNTEDLGWWSDPRIQALRLWKHDRRRVSRSPSNRQGTHAEIRNDSDAWALCKAVDRADGRTYSTLPGFTQISSNSGLGKFIYQVLWVREIRKWRDKDPPPGGWTSCAIIREGELNCEAFGNFNKKL